MPLSYAEGNTYTPIDRWTIYARESTQEPWYKLKVTEDRAEMRRFVEDLNNTVGWQKYAQSRHDA